MRKIIIGILVVFVCMIIGRYLVMSVVVASVNDEKILFREIHRVFLEKLREENLLTYEEILDYSIEDIILIENTPLGEEELVDLVEERVSLLKEIDPRAYEQIMKNNKDKYKEYLKNMLQIEYAIKAIKQKVGLNLEVSDKEIKDWYYSNFEGSTDEDFNNLTNESKTDIKQILENEKISKEVKKYLKKLELNYEIKIYSKRLEICKKLCLCRVVR
ncbi:MAG: hypothetical protein ACRCTE_13920 [Cellulosilyticaceae bacterium]